MYESPIKDIRTLLHFIGHTIKHARAFEISSGEKKHKRLITGIELMRGTKPNLTLTTPSAGVGLKVALFMELGQDYPFAFTFLSSARGCGKGESE